MGDVTAWSDSNRITLATSLAEAAAVPHDWIGLGRMDLGRLVLLVANDRRELAEVSRGRLPSWSAGATLSGSRLVMIRVDADNPFQTLRHELAHVALHQAVRGRVPLWFDEGYAVVAAQEYDRFASLRLNLAVVTGHVPELRALDQALRGSDVDAETAYALAGSAVDELRRHCRNGDLGTLMNRLRAGTPFDDAVLQSTGYTMDQFEVAWSRSVRHRYNWFVWLATGGLWMLVTLGLSWAAATRRRRDAPRRAALDEGWQVPAEDDETITIQGVGPHSS